MSIMGNNMIPPAIAIGEKQTSFISDHYKFIKNNKIQERYLQNSTNHNLDTFDYHLAKWGEVAPKTMECNQNHSFFYPNEEAEENDEEEHIWRAQRELDICVEEQ